jgi:hypothetical protein
MSTRISRNGKVGGTTRTSGWTYFQPNSAERLVATSVDEFLASAKRVFPEAGHAVIFNARTWHLGGVNYLPPRSATVQAKPGLMETR